MDIFGGFYAAYHSMNHGKCIDTGTGFKADLSSVLTSALTRGMTIIPLSVCSLIHAMDIKSPGYYEDLW